MNDVDWGILILSMFTLAFAACDVLFRGFMYPREGDIYSRLRAWLRPYPDDAQIQAEMLRKLRTRMCVRGLPPGLHAYRTGSGSFRIEGTPRSVGNFQFTAQEIHIGEVR